MSIFSKILQSTSRNISKAIHKELRGIYNVTYNNKIATYIKTDLDSIDNALRYAKGNKNKGAKHIRLGHTLDEKQEGYISTQELLNLGKNIREYLSKHKEPFIDKNGARLYEWQNEAGDKFRVVINKAKGEGNSNLPQLPKPLNDEIITFYSDRNLQNKMKFKNPALNQNKHTSSHKLESNALINEKLPPMMRE